MDRDIVDGREGERMSEGHDVGSKVIVVVVFSLAVAGCSGSSDSETATTPVPVTSTTTPSPTVQVATTTTTHPPPTTTSTTTTTTPPPPAPFATPSREQGTWTSWSASNRIEVRGLAIAADGDPWVITSGGLVHWDSTGRSTTITDRSWPDPQPYSIVATPDGDIWLGFHNDVFQTTPTGTVRHEFTPNSEGWSGMHLAVAPDGNVWAGAAQTGVHRFDGTTWHSVIAELPSRDDLDTLTVDDLGRLWLGTYWRGLWVLDSGELRQETAATTRVAQAGPGGDVWYNIDDGHGEDATVIHIDGTSGIRTTYPLGTTNVWDIAPYADGAYIVTNPLQGDDGDTHGLWRLENGRITALPGSWDEPKDQILALALDDSGSVWFGGQGGLWRFDGKNEEHYVTDTYSSFSIGFVTSGRSDVWAGDCDRSSVYDEAHWSSLPDNPAETYVCHTIIDADGVRWIAGDDGIAHLDGNRWVVDTKDTTGTRWWDLYPPCGDEVCEDPRWSLAAGQAVWAAMIGVEDGLWQYRPGGWQRMSGLPAGTGAITDIVAADDGTLWVAADNGVYHLHSGTWTGYPAGDDGPPLQLKKIAAGGDRVWVRAYGEIAVLAGDNWTRFSLPEEMYDLRILLVDAEGAVWLPSSSGAQRFDGESFTDLAIPAPPPIYIQGMTVDQAGAWWMATGDRLYRWMP